MNFVFVENRYKTLFWEAIVHYLLEDGHHVGWIVQNPTFTPQVGRVTHLPFPLKSDLSDYGSSSALDFIAASDRNINYFGGDSRHYLHYQTTIDRLLDALNPDVVVGESTLFHELMAVDWCRRKRVRYLHPAMIGYPGGRYTVFSGDQKVPVWTSSPVPSDDECLTVAEAIRRRERIPDYMVPPDVNDPLRVEPMPGSMQDRLRIVRGYIAGERFNTPAPWVKWRLDRLVRRQLRHWEDIAEVRDADSQGKKVLLYPLQLQPESNLDVWGQRHRNQSELVRTLADNLPKDWHLLVKANPKAKYEMTDDLVSTLREHPAASPVSLNRGMAEVISRASMICTVTGTVAVECVLSRKPLVQLGPSIVEDGPGCVQARNVRDVISATKKVDSGQFEFASDSERIALVRKLYSTTFHGLVSDPSTLPAVMRKDNVAAVARQISQVASVCVT